MGLSEEEAHCAVRFSLRKDTTEEEIDYTFSTIGMILENDEQVIRFVSCH